MYSAILLMAGKGTRMNRQENKVLLPLGNKKIYEYSLNVFLKTVDEIICVINEDDKDIITSLPKNVKWTFGGKTRQESVLNGIKLATNDFVLIHDAARPFITESLINDIKNKLTNNNCVLTCQKCKDTLKLVDGDVVSTLNRDRIIRAATPQAINRKLLLESYSKIQNEEFTDDVQIIEKYHPEIKTELIYASDDLFKITTNTDYKLAELLWRNYD
ncbi:MAG: 2-C-methyl-D-erythritol 4-phosphate cytidylyltransferase [Acholeplasmatales bacterium]|nr:2-C-methyl-D-erythritol 4-phosphate cytidylyltransferase [Acholeplasmatales bacterium]